MIDDLLTTATAEELAAETVAKVVARFREETQPRVKELLAEQAAVLLRSASGQDVTLQQAAIESSLANLTLGERAVLHHTAVDFVLRLLLRLLRV